MSDAPLPTPQAPALPPGWAPEILIADASPETRRDKSAVASSFLPECKII